MKLVLIVTALFFLPAGCSRDRGLEQDVPMASGIMACGVILEPSVRVVRWDQPGGLNAYRSDGSGHFGHRGDRTAWTFEELRQHVNLVVIHYDAVGSSHRCFEVLQRRGLSCHLLIDTNGVVYQTLDLRERAWHATVVNDRSIGIELAHLGAIGADSGSIASDDIIGVVQHRRLRQRPFTEAQYHALSAVLAVLHQAFPRIALNYPRQSDGLVVTFKLEDARLSTFQGVVGHYHIQTNKIDPGPAFEWDRVLSRARALAAQ